MFGGKAADLEGLLSRPLAPSRLTLPSDIAQSIFCSFPSSFKLFLLFPIFLWEFSFCFKAGKKYLFLQDLPALTRGNPPHLRSAYGIDLVREDGLFPASVPTHSLSHADSPSFYFSLILLPLHHFTTAFAAVLTSPAAQELRLYPYYENLISLAGSTLLTIIIRKERNK